MVDNFAKPGSILAVVSDSYNVYNAASKLWGEELRQKVIDSGATVVIRPDSGDPIEVNNNLVRILDQKFGSTVNAKGFKVLNNVRLIQGDGVNELTIRGILGSFMALGYSADNIAFGMGGALLQQVDRDTQKFAMKCSAVEIGSGNWINVQKDPITDPGKKSKAGCVTLWKSGGEYVSAVDAPKGWSDKAIGPWTDVLEPVYRDGKLLKDITFDQVRANARK
jgi:nicotinamide phosphoribosyltransferase